MSSMKKYIWIASGLAALGVVAVLVWQANSQTAGCKTPDNEVIVVFNDGISNEERSQIRRQYDATLKQSFSSSVLKDYEIWTLARGTASEKVAEISHNSSIQDVDLNRCVSID
jgi:hypothetical protein